MPLGRDLLDMIPFRDPAACEAARAISAAEITRREPHHHPDFRLRVIDEPAALYDALAEDMLGRFVQAADEGRRFVGVFPVGPTGQYPLLAEKINQRRVALSHVHLFFLDEYACEDGSTIDKLSPWSFERIAREKLIAAIDEPLRPAAIHFPGSDNVDHYDEMILKASDGRGADVIYGGIGWCGHFAFWEPHLWEEFGGDMRQGEGLSSPSPVGAGKPLPLPLEAWRSAHTAHVRLHPMTILHNALRAGGDWSSIPPCAYTIGPNVLLSAQYRSFWLDAYLGGGMSWQRFIGRLATHGPVTPLVPASFLQTVPGEVVFLKAVAEDIGGPRTSWQ